MVLAHSEEMVNSFTCRAKAVVAVKKGFGSNSKKVQAACKKSEGRGHSKSPHRHHHKHHHCGDGGSTSGGSGPTQGGGLNGGL